MRPSLTDPRSIIVEFAGSGGLIVLLAVIVAAFLLIGRTDK
jgi:hypothetical protein